MEFKTAHSLSPVEIKNKEFNRTLIGYAPKEVVEFLDSVAKTWEAVQRQERALSDKIQKLEEELKAWKARESELDELRQQAGDEAKIIHTQATEDARRFMKGVHERAEEIRERTEGWLENVIKEVEQAEKKKESFMTAVKSTLDEHYAILKEEAAIPPLHSQIDRLKASTSNQEE